MEDEQRLPQVGSDSDIKDVLDTLDLSMEYYIAEAEQHNHLGVVEVGLGGEGVLHTKSFRVPDDKELRQTLYNLLSTFMLDDPGYGVSAIQLGFNLRVFAIRLEDKSLLVAFNPYLEPDDPEKKVISKEGCLSIAGGVSYTSVARYSGVTLAWEDIDGERHQGSFDQGVEKYSHEVFAVQHEYDHLNGVLITDEERKPKAEKVEVKVGRNDPCPCKKGKKFKHCCGR